MHNYSYQFTHAITRRPASTITAGLRAENIGDPCLDSMLEAHAAYCATLRKTGAKVIELDPLESFPDAQFVEDTALCLPQGAILMRPGAPSRVGEVAEIAPVIHACFDKVEEIKSPGHIEGGDILVTEKEILVGRSARTDADGVSQLAMIVDKWGYKLREVLTPEGVLHFKTDCSLMDEETILATKRLDASGCFNGYRVLHVADGEEAAANAIRFNNVVIMAQGFPKTADMLAKFGYEIAQIDNLDCAKLDGGMSCLSLRFSATK